MDSSEKALNVLELCLMANVLTLVILYSLQTIFFLT